MNKLAGGAAFSSIANSRSTNFAQALQEEEGLTEEDQMQRVINQAMDAATLDDITTDKDMQALREKKEKKKKKEKKERKEMQERQEKLAKVILNIQSFILSS